MEYIGADLCPVCKEGTFKCAIGSLGKEDCLEACCCSVHLNYHWWEPGDGVDLTFSQETVTSPETFAFWFFPRRVALGPLFKGGPDPKPQLQA